MTSEGAETGNRVVPLRTDLSDLSKGKINERRILSIIEVVREDWPRHHAASILPEIVPLESKDTEFLKDTLLKMPSNWKSMGNYWADLVQIIEDRGRKVEIQKIADKVLAWASEKIGAGTMNYERFVSKATLHQLINELDRWEKEPENRSSVDAAYFHAAARECLDRFEKIQ